MLKLARIVPVTALVLVASGVLACGGYGNSSSPSPTTVSAQPTSQPTQEASGGGSPGQTSGPTAMSIVDFGYSPDTLTAQTGQQMSLNVRNNGQAAHTFTITGVVDSGTISAGQSKTESFTPSAAGSLQFFCTIHGASVMSGRITVQ